jgi:hypothetical protein
MTLLGHYRPNAEMAATSEIRESDIQTNNLNIFPLSGEGLEECRLLFINKSEIVKIKGNLIMAMVSNYTVHRYTKPIQRIFPES